MAIAEPTDESFEAGTATNGVVIVYFRADMGVAREFMDSVMEELAGRHPEVRFLKLHVDQNPVTAVTHNILSIPTLIVFENGVEVRRLVGAVSIDVLQRDLSEYLIKSSRI